MNAKSFKPDLAVIKNKVLLDYFDLKSNLGRKRDLSEYVRH